MIREMLQLLFKMFQSEINQPERACFSAKMIKFASVNRGKSMKRLIALSVALLCAWGAYAGLWLPQMFQSGMVLQRSQPIPVWGKAAPGATVEVSFRKKRFTAQADAQGCWQVTLPKQKAGGPYDIVITESPSVSASASAADAVSKVTLTDVLIGDVWLCSGQSNIDVTIERVYPQYTTDIDNYSNRQIRLFRVATDTDTHGPKSDVKPTTWRTLDKQNAWTFSAVGYFLGREMYEKTGVPQGIIVNSLGGTPIQAWLPADTLRQHFPEAYSRTVYFQNDQLVASLQQSNQQANNRWQHMMDSLEAKVSLSGNAEGLSPFLFASSQFDDSQWRCCSQYGNITAKNRHSGSYWARQHVAVDAAHAGKPARLLVGTLFDADYTFMNGREVGRTYYQYPPRRYTVPAGVLREGDNVLAVRFVTKNGNPHFIPEKPYKLIFDDGTELALSEQWLVGEGVSMPSCPQADANIQNLPSVLYNAMLHPLAPYGLTGVVWYQGESNTGEGDIYEQMLTQLIGSWRHLWHQQLPFVVVQLANFMQPSERPQDSGWSHVREAQRLAARNVPQTELAVTIDLGETVDIHPLRKWEVAQRVARGFDRMLWHPSTLVSPEVLSARVVSDGASGIASSGIAPANAQGCSVVLTVDQPLKKVDAPLRYFEVAASDGRYQQAEASLSADGRHIIVKSPVAVPVSLRYAWKDNPLGANVFSLEDLPMSPFQMAVTTE